MVKEVRERSLGDQRGLPVPPVGHLGSFVGHMGLLGGHIGPLGGDLGPLRGVLGLLNDLLAPHKGHLGPLRGHRVSVWSPAALKKSYEALPMVF